MKKKRERKMSKEKCLVSLCKEKQCYNVTTIAKLMTIIQLRIMRLSYSNVILIWIPYWLFWNHQFIFFLSLSLIMWAHENVIIVCFLCDKHLVDWKFITGALITHCVQYIFDRLEFCSRFFFLEWNSRWKNSQWENTEQNKMKSNLKTTYLMMTWIKYDVQQ